MATTAKRVEAALNRKGLRHLVAAIKDNPATPGEVVIYPMGAPVWSVKQAIEIARAAK